MRRSAYDILGVPKTASRDTIRHAYRTLARDAHPDRAGGTPEAHERFLEIKAAYEVLEDTERRAAYDVDPTGELEAQILFELERRRAALLRRRKRLMRLYDT